MTDRIPLDHLTSDQYDALCTELAALREVARGYCPHCGRGDAAPTVTDWEAERQRAEQAEAVITRVREYAIRWQAVAATKDDAVILAGVAADILLGTLDQPTPAATQATGRLYYCPTTATVEDHTRHCCDRPELHMPTGGAE
ncbi:hypothetical protein AB0F30_16740 [Streptomyces sp. NPDC029006]|uniref:hypothetical protein n=1 Tax=Streptomyces sp. NPDC029006 TaxID=3155467 RepID=UPI0033CF6706